MQYILRIYVESKVQSYLIFLDFLKRMTEFVLYKVIVYLFFIPVSLKFNDLIWYYIKMYFIQIYYSIMKLTFMKSVSGK